MTHSVTRRQYVIARAVIGMACSAVLGLALAACDEITSLDQDAPSRVDAGDLESPENAGLLVQGAVGDFECALAHYIVAGGLVTDELGNAFLADGIWDFDRRTIVAQNPAYSAATCEATIGTVYTTLSTARYSADHSIQLLDGWTDAQVPGRINLIATAATYAGYSLVLLGEGMCSAAIDVGPELTPAQLFTEAEARFARAIESATAAGNTELATLARLGRARARVGLGNLPGAAEEAAQVPAGFVVNATYSGARIRRENTVHTHLYRDLLSTVEPVFRDLTFGGVPDPRVAVIDAGILGADATTPIFQPAKYPDIASPIPVGRWEEAQLILAEAAAVAGDVSTAVGIINALHANAGLPAYAGGTPEEVRNQVIVERSRELFLEGHRLGDFIRYGLPLNPPPGAPFPVAGGVYGSQVCFPLPFVERFNNPNIPD